MNDPTAQVRCQLSQLLLQSLKVNAPLYHLELLRQKLENRSLDSLDKKDIMSELGKLQAYHRQLNTEMLQIYDLLNQSL